MSRNNKVKIADSAANINPCIMCNPKRYLKFSFAFVSYEKSEPKQIDLVKMWERMRWMSKDTFANMTYLLYFLFRLGRQVIFSWKIISTKNINKFNNRFMVVFHKFFLTQFMPMIIKFFIFLIFLMAI